MYHGEQIGDAVVVDECDVESGHDGRLGPRRDDMTGEISESPTLVHRTGFGKAQPSELSVLER